VRAAPDTFGSAFGTTSFQSTPGGSGADGVTFTTLSDGDSGAGSFGELAVKRRP
jgi:hypothetical protein